MRFENVVLQLDTKTADFLKSQATRAGISIDAYVNAILFDVFLKSIPETKNPIIEKTKLHNGRPTIPHVCEAGEERYNNNRTAMCKICKRFMKAPKPKTDDTERTYIKIDPHTVFGPLKYPPEKPINITREDLNKMLPDDVKENLKKLQKER